MYTIKQASARAGVGVPLLRAWERRYGIPKPARTASGYRLYGDEAIAQVRSMRQLVEDGWAPRQAAAEVVAGRGPGATGGADIGVVTSGKPEPAPTSQIARIVAAASALDEAAIETALVEATLGADFETVVERIWLPALVAVGEAWASGDLDVACEHALSAAVLRRLGSAYEASARPLSRPQVLVGLPPGARHELGALAFAVFARRAGLIVLYLGPDVPVESWTRAVQETAAGAVVLGAVTPPDRDAARKVLVELSKLASRPAMFIGGPAATNSDNLPGEILPHDLQAAVKAVRAGFSFTS
jgi:methanogenic corrinoid protein MtbC1